MAFLRIRKSIKIAPGVKLNLNKKSASVTVGPKGAHYTVSSNGSQTKTVGMPGTGVSLVDRHGPHAPEHAHSTAQVRGDNNPPAIAASSAPVEQVSFDAMATDTSGDVPKTLADRNRLITEQPAGWEHLLLAAELFLGVQALEPMWHGYLDHKGAGEHHPLSPLEAINFLRDRFDEGVVAVEPINEMSDPKLQEQAFGKPGEAGDPVEIQMLARLVTQPYEEMLRMAASARAQDVPLEFQDVFQMFAEWIGQPLAQIRKFVYDFVTDLDDIQSKIANHRPEDPPIEVRAQLSLTLDDALQARLQRAIHHAGEA